MDFETFNGIYEKVVVVFLFSLKFFRKYANQDLQTICPLIAKPPVKFSTRSRYQVW